MDWFSAIVAACLGLVLGSFYNVCIHRYLSGENIVFPASHCPHCEKTLGVLELVPIFSWLALRGRCKGCGEAISIRYPVVEAISGAWALLLALSHGPSIEFLVYMVFGGALIVITFIDLEEYIIPDIIDLPGAVLAFLCAGLLLDVGWVNSLIGAAAGAGIFWLLRFVFFKIKGVEGLGLGDVKLMLMIGALLGWMALPEVILLGSVTALVMGLAQRFFDFGAQEDGRRLIPFGPFLAMGAMIRMLVGDALLIWYIGQYAG
jgi:leader peptidase (prepilin peptidase)/N-methyltransferase